MRLVQDVERRPEAEPTDEALAERVREEIFAAVTLPRAALVRRAAARAGVEAAQIRALVERLVAIGDVTEGAAGILASTPVRLVDRGAGRGWWLGSTPERWLARHAPGVRLAAGWPREVVLDDDARAAVARFGGIELTARAWAGVEDVVPAEAWIDEVLVQVARVAAVSGALVPDASRPSHLTLDGRWETGIPAGQDPVLLRWTEMGFPRWGIASGARLLPLTPDDARRGALALRHAGGRPANVRVVVEGDRAEITTDAWLPSAEWRLLVGLAENVHRAGRSVRAELGATLARELLSALQRAGLREEQ